MNEIELRYRGIRALVSITESGEEPVRGHFVGITGDVVGFEGRGIDNVVATFCKTVDEYLAHETADTLLSRIVSHDPSEPWTEREKRKYLLYIHREMEEMEREESLDELLKRVEDLALKISRKLKDREPYKIVRLFEEAALRGVERARKRKHSGT